MAIVTVMGTVRLARVSSENRRGVRRLSNFLLSMSPAREISAKNIVRSPGRRRGVPSAFARMTLPFSCPLTATTAGQSPHIPANVFRELSPCLSSIRPLSATRGYTSQSDAKTMDFGC